MISTREIRRWVRADSTVLRTAAAPKATAVLKPSMVSVPETSLSMLLGAAMAGMPISARCLVDLIVSLPPVARMASMPAFFRLARSFSGSPAALIGLAPGEEPRRLQNGAGFLLQAHRIRGFERQEKVLDPIGASALEGPFDAHELQTITLAAPPDAGRQKGVDAGAVAAAGHEADTFQLNPPNHCKVLSTKY